MWAWEGEGTAWTQSSCCLSWYELFVSDPGVWCLLPACTKMWLGNLLHCKQGEKNLRLFIVVDSSTPDFVIHLNTVIFEKRTCWGTISSNLPFIFHIWSWVTVSSSLLIKNESLGCWTYPNGPLCPFPEELGCNTNIWRWKLNLIIMK